jgi:UDP-glucose 4-epimerase
MPEADPFGGLVAVTPIAGCLGRRLARALHRQGSVIGIDFRPFPDRPKDVEHFQIDVRSRKTRDLFRRLPIRALVHLGVLHDSYEHGADHHARNVLGFQQLLECVQGFEVEKLVLVSSSVVYGPRADNPQLLSEDSPLLGAGVSEKMRDLVTLDMLTQSFFWKHAGTETVILRPGQVLGTVANTPSNYLRLKVVPTLLGFDPMVQVVHQDDVVQAIVRALVPGVRGIFNIAGPPPVPLSQVLALLGRATVPVPHTLARTGLERLWRWRMSAFPASELDFLRYVCMVDDSRARQLLGYRPRFGLDETLRGVDAERWI